MESIYKWKYNAVIYSKTTGEIFLEKRFDICEEAECFIEQNMKQFEEFFPTGHITKDYVFIGYR